MRRFLAPDNRWSLVAIITIGSILVTQLLMYAVYELLEEEVQLAAFVVSVLAPGIIAPLVTWYLIGLLIELNTLETEMRELATHDQLTGLLTRKAFLDKSAARLEMLNRGGGQFDVLMVDLDHFKKINDLHGHGGGDFMLRRFGEIVRQNRRKADLIGRFGGEEFIFMLWGTSREGAINYANFLQQAMQESNFYYEGRRIVCTISIGIYHHSATDKISCLEDIIQRADRALYKAKNGGRSRAEVYDDSCENRNPHDCYEMNL